MFCNPVSILPANYPTAVNPRHPRSPTFPMSRDLLIGLLLLAVPVTVCADGPDTAAERGDRWLRTRTYLPPDFDQRVFDRLWTNWSTASRERARKASEAERRRMTFAYYGLMPDPDVDDPYARPALGYVADGKGGWVMNCLACHAGKVAGQVIPGLPNSHIALQTLTEDVRLTKLKMLKPLSHLDLVSLKLPLGTTHGTTNSVVFGVVLGALRDADMNVHLNRKSPVMRHHDMDAPPLWNVKLKRQLYCDGFAPKNHRVLMQFMLIPKTTPAILASWEDEFRDILAWIESLEPPPWPFRVDRSLARQGRAVFHEHCARCHGTYGADRRYPEKVVPIDEVGTDPVRLTALTRSHREWIKRGWLSRYGKDPVELDPIGYVAPPLDGIWATAPYLHNGSVPTLWHMLHPNRRPAVWRRTADGYDRERVGLETSNIDRIPVNVIRPADRRAYFNTRRPGKSAAGHRFPDALTEEQKRAVLEYLKTL